MALLSMAQSALLPEPGQASGAPQQRRGGVGRWVWKRVFTAKSAQLFPLVASSASDGLFY